MEIGKERVIKGDGEIKMELKISFKDEVDSCVCTVHTHP